MPVKITFIEPNSPADRAGIKVGDCLVSVNEHEISDILDYRFYTAESKLKLELVVNGRRKKVKIKKEEYAELGIESETYLMDGQRSCKNNCVFCFIDQLPPGLRESLYFKDDDTRLSFLFGNYVTLTNLTDHDVERIIEMKISPVNISVHTTNPELRKQMMNNRFAGESLAYIKRFADAGISMNCQLVLCPGINDGDELRRSIEDLAAFYPAVSSVAAVPVGLSKHREGLYPLKGFTKETAADVVKIINRFGGEFLKKNDTRLVYPADEFFNMAGVEIPEPEYYESFAQLENGVGMTSLFLSEAYAALEEKEEPKTPLYKTVATGTAFYPFMKSLVDYTAKKWHNINSKTIEIKNEFFGESITVAGLITGGDLVKQLKGLFLGDELLISSGMLRRAGDLFLDGMSLDELSEVLQVKVTPVENDGGAFIDALFNGKDG